MTSLVEHSVPDGTCHQCGKNLADDGDHQDHHVLCWRCWREENGIEEPAWRKPRPQPGTTPPSIVEGLAKTREQLRALAAEIRALGERVDEIERGRAA